MTEFVGMFDGPVGVINRPNPVHQDQARKALDSIMGKRALLAAREAIARRVEVRRQEPESYFAHGNPEAIRSGKLDDSSVIQIAAQAALIAMTEVL